jgi:stress response protein YsnF
MVEEPGIKKPQVETGRAGISKTVHERQGIVDEPLCREEVSIERVPIRRFVDRAMPTRYEGNTMIVPLPGRQLEAHLSVGVTLRREEAL